MGIGEEMSEENERIKGDALVWGLNNWRTIYCAEETEEGKGFERKHQVLFRVLY